MCFLNRYTLKRVKNLISIIYFQFYLSVSFEVISVINKRLHAVVKSCSPVGTGGLKKTVSYAHCFYNHWGNALHVQRCCINLVAM